MQTSSTSEEAREKNPPRGELLADRDKPETLVIDVKLSMLCVSDCASDLSMCARVCVCARMCTLTCNCIAVLRVRICG